MFGKEYEEIRLKGSFFFGKATILAQFLLNSVKTTNCAASRVILAQHE